MPCIPFRDGDVSGFICMRGQRTQRCACGNKASRLCDGPPTKRKRESCDAPLCDKCTTKRYGRDLCSKHRDIEIAPLQVYTAQYRYSGPDRFDITRSYADACAKTGARSQGSIFAPSHAILVPALEARRCNEGEAHWPGYVEAYTAEMRKSYTKWRERWDELLRRDRVTLVCFCNDVTRCHRGVLAGILVKLGATSMGEVT